MKNYYFFSSREIPEAYREDWRRSRWRHNRRVLRISGFFSLFVSLMISLINLLNVNPSVDAGTRRLYMTALASIAVYSLLFLGISFSVSRRGYRRWYLYFHRGAYVIFCSLFGFLKYVDMQVAPDYSALLGVIIFFSAVAWIDSLSYLGYLVIISVVATINFHAGVHTSVTGAGLILEMVIFYLVGMGLFYFINEMRTRTFVTGRQLEQNIEELKDLSLRDPLTRLFNRRMMNEELDRQTALSRRTGQPLTIILLDIDHFKRVNDSLGHSVGDEVLRQCAGRLVETVRESDSVYRFGGEEFLLMLPNSSLPSARALAERLLTTFSGELFDGVPWPVTVSMGVSDSSERLLPADMIKLADCRLYAAKDAGRNRFDSESCSDEAGEEPVIP